MKPEPCQPARPRHKHVWAAAFASAWVAAVVLAPCPAAASCISPPPKLLWSYPADGQTGVPTNADLWVSGDSLAHARLNGAELVRNEYGGFELGQLTPYTRYELTWPSSRDDPSAKPITISFVTGATPLPEAPDALRVAEPPVITRTQQAAPPCPLVPSQGCFDTGTPTAIRFDAGQAPIAFILNRRACDGTMAPLVWPASCGAPVLETYGIGCSQLRMTDGAHVGPATALYCSAPLLPPGISLAMSSGCLSDWPPANATTIAGRDGVPSSREAPAVATAGAPAPAGSNASPLASDDPAIPTHGVEPDGGSSCSVAPAAPGGGTLALCLSLAIGCCVAARRRHRLGAFMGQRRHSLPARRRCK